jgi:hypothetical protein
MKAPLLSGCPSSNSELGQIRVHVLYKWAEIPAKTVIPAIALSVTYRKQESPANTGSIPVSATNLFRIIRLRIVVQKAGFETRFLIDVFPSSFLRPAKYEAVISESISTAAEESGIVTSQ